MIRLLVLFLSLILCTRFVRSSPGEEIKLTDVTAESGIQFRHTDGGSGRRYIVEYISAGLALFDYDADGDIDIYFLSGAPHPGSDFDTPPRNILYRNDGNWRFTDVTQKAGVGHTGHGLGVAVGDFNSDGHEDLYINNFGENVLYRNNGDGTFADVTKQAGVANGRRVGAGTNFVDIDADGDLDLFVGNYVKFSYDKHIVRTQQGFAGYVSPRDYEADADTIYRNNGDGTFTDISTESGIAKKRATSMGSVCADYDQDGDLDIFVANDVAANFLYENNGRGEFREAGLLRGFAYDSKGSVHGSMGVNCGDVDGDGRLDFHVTSYQNEVATLYKNTPGNFLMDVTAKAKAGIGTRSQVTWGNAFVDFDNDGDRDLFVACGHLYDNVAQFNNAASYEARNLLFVNDGKGKFRKASSSDGLEVQLSSRGAAFADMDNDGDLDTVVLNINARPTLLRNDTKNLNNWFAIELSGPQNRFGIGARIELTAGGRKTVQHVHSGQGYQSHYGTRVHFGLGTAQKVDLIEVFWPGGKRETFKTTQVRKMVRLNSRKID